MNKDIKEKDITAAEETSPEKKKISKKTLIISSVAALLVIAIVTSVIVFAFFTERGILADFSKDFTPAFKTVKWGMDSAEVKERFNGTLTTDSTYKLVYKTDKFMGIDEQSHLFFDFDGYNGLWQISAGYNTSGARDVFVTRLISAFEERYGDCSSYKESVLNTEYVWEDEKTHVRISILSTYVSIYITDVNYVIRYDD